MLKLKQIRHPFAAEVAKENSADPGSARNGGDLDFSLKA